VRKKAGLELCCGKREPQHLSVLSFDNGWLKRSGLISGVEHFADRLIR
jgi:hypothetical protein